MELNELKILVVKDFHGGYGHSWVLKGLSFVVSTGEMITVAGPNGCGKSSLVRGICHLLPEQQGQVWILGKSFQELGRKGFAQLVSVVPQQVHFFADFTVKEMVMIGRLPRLKRFIPRSNLDHRVVEKALVQVDLYKYRHRTIGTLSGGEKQRVIIAQALAQEPKLLILDEPTAYLDLNHQMEIMELLQKLRDENGMTIMLTSHDLNLATMFSTRLLMMKDGRFVADGKPSKVLSKGLLREVYNVDVILGEHPDEKIPYIILKKKHHEHR